MDKLMCLEELLSWLESGSKVRISVHDVSGILHSKQELMLQMEHMIHASDRCMGIKTTSKGLRACLRCKLLSIKKAMESHQAFIGQCISGITEIVQPVYKNNKLMAIIYIGNLVDPAAKRKPPHKACKAMEELTHENLDRYRKMAEMIKSYILLTAAKVNARGTERHLSPVYTEAGHWAVRAAKEYVDRHYNQKIRLSHIAKEYFINEEYLCRIFKQQTGKSFTEYLNDIRIDHAKVLMMSEKRKMIDVAAKVGFDNAPYFNKVFRRSTNMSPTEFIQSEQN